MSESERVLLSSEDFRIERSLVQGSNLKVTSLNGATLENGLRYSVVSSIGDLHPVTIVRRPQVGKKLSYVVAVGKPYNPTNRS